MFQGGDYVKRISGRDWGPFRRGEIYLVHFRLGPYLYVVGDELAGSTKHFRLATREEIKKHLNKDKRSGFAEFIHRIETKKD